MVADGGSDSDDEGAKGTKKKGTKAADKDKQKEKEKEAKIKKPAKVVSWQADAVSDVCQGVVVVGILEYFGSSRQTHDLSPNLSAHVCFSFVHMK